MQTVLCWLRGYAQEPKGRKVLNTAESIHSRKTLLSRNSKLASPPVLTWLTLSSVFHLAEHVAVSPPPITWSFHLMQEKSVDKMQHAFLKKKKKKTPETRKRRHPQYNKGYMWKTHSSHYTQWFIKDWKLFF